MIKAVNKKDNANMLLEAQYSMSSMLLAHQHMKAYGSVSNK